VSARILTASLGKHDANDARCHAKITKLWQGTFPEFVEQILAKVPETDDKASVGWVCGAAFDRMHRHGDYFVGRDFLSLDYDHIAPTDVEKILAACRGVAHLAYSTWSSTPERPRLRVWIPLSRASGADEFQAVSRKFAARAGIELAARESHAASQFMFRPAKQKGIDFQHWTDTTSPALDVDAVLGEYGPGEAWLDRAKWPRRADGDELSATGKAESPLEKRGTVGEFCRRFRISEAIETFDLPYKPGSSEGRWTYIHGSRADGAVSYDEDTKLHVHHDSDVARGQHNAWDLVRLQLYGKLDTDADKETPVMSRPSSFAMLAMLREKYPELVVVPQADAEFDALPDEEGAAPGTAVAPSAQAGILQARFDCTDQKNAQRLIDAYGNGKKLMAVDDVFYAWDGTHWKKDATDKARESAQSLTKIIGLEAQAYREAAKAAKAIWDGTITAEQRVRAADHPRTPKYSLEQGPAYEKYERLAKKASELEKWAKDSEMTSRQDAALKQVRERLKTDPAKLDSNPSLFNCPNGTINLETGELRDHNPADLITVCGPVPYNRAAKAPKFRSFLNDVFGGDQELIRYMQSWYGYSITGEVSEQKLLIHYGEGSNGKGVLAHIIERVVGEYACSAPRTLLADDGRGNERHPAEIMKLKGKRLVTAYEPDNAAVLREGTIKWLTGGDTLTARAMHENFSDFRPTHKLQLITNADPVVKSQDHGIWRRILRVKYQKTYGTAEDIAAGKAQFLKHLGLEDELLRDESEGILAWLVEGAKDWYRERLKEPEAIVRATKEYRDSQDRIGTFVTERCVLDPQARVSYGEMYSGYKGWCERNGYIPMSSGNFNKELPRTARGVQQDNDGWKVKVGTLRTTERGFRGIRLTSEYFSDDLPPDPPPPPTPKPQPEALVQQKETSAPAEPPAAAKLNGANGHDGASPFDDPPPTTPATVTNGAHAPAPREPASTSLFDLRIDCLGTQKAKQLWAAIGKDRMRSISPRTFEVLGLDEKRCNEIEALAKRHNATSCQRVQRKVAAI
jgi:P4 family phage/plasmid primase-like protien